MNDDSHDEHKAITYARWLAERDGLILPAHPEIGLEWARPRMTDGRHVDRIKAVTFDGDRYAVTIKLPGWDYDPSPMKGPPAGET